MQREVGTWKTCGVLLAVIGTYCVPGAVLGPDMNPEHLELPVYWGT